VKENRFFKKENVEKDLNDKYWDERFTFRGDMVPIFLEKQKSRVLQAGKYLNVIRECGRVDVKNPLEDKIDQMGFSFGWLGKVDTDY
jgi:gamma-tubulin complex component 2